MKYLQFLAQLNPEISFSAPSYDSYVHALSENFLYAILLFIAFMVSAFVCYYAFGILYLAWQRYMTSSTNYEGTAVQIEIIKNA